MAIPSSVACGASPSTYHTSKCESVYSGWAHLLGFYVEGIACLLLLLASNPSVVLKAWGCAPYSIAANRTRSRHFWETVTEAKDACCPPTPQLLLLQHRHPSHGLQWCCVSKPTVPSCLQKHGAYKYVCYRLFNPNHKQLFYRNTACHVTPVTPSHASYLTHLSFASRSPI